MLQQCSQEMTVSEYSRLKPGAEYIYETPDSGRSIYAREVGTNERFLIGRRMNDRDFVDDQVWLDILRLSKIHSNLAEEVDKILTLYYLIKDNSKGDVMWHPV